MDWESRADLAERMWPVAASFACLVHEGDAPGIAAFLGALDPAEADAFAIVLAAMVPVEAATPAQLLAWVGGPPGEPELPLEWPRGAEPEPVGHTAQELRAAVAEAMRLKRHGQPVPDDLADLVYAYGLWRKQVRGERKIPVPGEAGGDVRAA